MDELQNYMRTLELEGENDPYYYWNFYTPGARENKYFIWARDLKEVLLILDRITINWWEPDNILKYKDIRVIGLSPEENRIYEEEEIVNVPLWTFNPTQVSPVVAGTFVRAETEEEARYKLNYYFGYPVNANLLYYYGMEIIAD